MSSKRWIAVVTGLLFVGAAYFVAKNVQDNWTSNEALANSAPQEQVAGIWAIKDAAIAGLQLLGVLGALMVVSLWSLSPESRSDEDERRVAAGDLRRCQFCREAIRTDATVCRYCSRDLAPHVQHAPTTPGQPEGVVGGAPSETP
jgi:hypothetical protein